jgi:glycosyltransferase involved in cell wall biosynthesis
MAKRVVVNLVGEPAHGQLAESRFVERPFLYGGERTSMDFAFAAASLGHHVELRGWLRRQDFDARAAVVGASPSVDLPARSPEPDDFVVVPEGWREPLDYLQLSLSPARLAMYVLAPPGLFGWPFTDFDWTPPDPLTVDISAVARAEHFAATRAMGFELLTNSRGLARAAERGGVSCRYLGSARPMTLPEPPLAKDVDVVALMQNRWAPLARQVLTDLQDLMVDPIAEVTNDEMLRRFGRARILLWPSRVEGHGSIAIEARALGCVPVALDTNPFAAELDEEHGAVTVSTTEELAPAVRALLADHERLHDLAARGRDAALRHDDWDSYVARVAETLAAEAPPDPARAARAAAGAQLRAEIAGLRDRHQERLEQLAKAKEDLTEATLNQARLLDELDRLRRIPLVRAALALSRVAGRARAPRRSGALRG